MWDKLKTVLVVAVMTVLIWLVADQYVREEQAFKIPVRVVPPDPGRYAAIVDPPYQITLNVRMAGRRGHLKEFSERLGANDKGFFEAVMDAAPNPEPRSLSAEKDILWKIDAIRQSHLSIKHVSPLTVPVRIDEYEVVQNVAVEPDFGDLEVSAATCTPDKVAVRLPRFAHRRLLAGKVIRPAVEGTVREAMKKGLEFRVPLTLTLDADPAWGVEIVPDEITVSGFVEARIATATKGPVQIHLSIPDEVQRRFVVEVAPGTDFRQTIEVTGPKELLAQLHQGDIRAFVDVMAGDMNEPGKEITRSVQYVLPPGFALAPDSPTHQITFKLVDRPMAATPGQ